MATKFKEISALTSQELQSKLSTEKDLLARLHFAHAISPIENPMKIRASKKLIAQISTALTIKNN